MTEPRDSDFSGDFSVESIETADQRTLRQEFALLGQENSEVFRTFDPDDYLAEARELRLETLYPELERAEHALTQVLRRGMLTNIGLADTTTMQIGDKVVFASDQDDVHYQVHYVDRQDGVHVPVFSTLQKKANSYETTYVRLESNKWVAEKQKEQERMMEELNADYRLMNEFGMDEKFIEASNMTLEDKQGMLAAYDAIQALETVQPEPAELPTLRQALVKAMMPATEFMTSRRSKKLPELTQRYIELIQSTEESYASDPVLARDFIQREQLLRLSAENRQLRIRQRTARLGAAAVTTGLTVACGAMGVGAGYLGYEMTADAAIGGGIIGAVSGFMVGMEQVRRVRKNSRHVNGFFETDHVFQSLEGQLSDEQSLAKAYMYLTRRY